jgi:heat-inducible transcriptional repressor
VNQGVKEVSAEYIKICSNLLQVGKRMADQAISNSVLNERAQHLLKVLVEHYIRIGQPIGSRTLARTAGLDLSPATIRNIMADLEEMGLLESPHTSAGRVPTTQGYRLFVDKMLKVKPLKLSVVDQLKLALDPDMNDQSLVESASSLLSGVTQLAGIVTVPRKEHITLRQIEFLELSENRVLVILVINQREVQNRIIHLDRAYSRSELQEATNYLNIHFAGCNLEEIRRRLLDELDSVREDMNLAMLAAIKLGEKALEADSRDEDSFVLVGQTKLMEYEELSDVDKLRCLFQAFTQQREILHLLDKCIRAEGVQIFFGQESGYAPLNNCSVVSASYSVEGNVVGVLGVIGPTRIAYDRVIPVVDVTAKLLGAALNTRH